MNKHKDCKHYDKQSDGIGLCKAHPPVATIERANSMLDPTLWSHPAVVNNDGACGEFVQKEE